MMEHRRGSLPPANILCYLTGEYLKLELQWFWFQRRSLPKTPQPPGQMQRTVGPHVRTPAGLTGPCFMTMVVMWFSSFGPSSTLRTAAPPTARLNDNNPANPTLHARSSPFGISNSAGRLTTYDQRHNTCGRSPTY